jgi:hypothetical protein
MATAWRNFLYSAAMLVMAIAITTSTSFGETDALPPPSDRPILAAQVPSSNAPASRNILLVIGITLVGMTYRQAWLNLRCRS